jgi:hypothetical protein
MTVLSTSLRSSRSFAAALVAAAALAYPLAVTVVDGSPRFPSTHDCAVTARGDGNIALLLGSFASEAPAGRLVTAAKKAGFVAARMNVDSCEQVQVVVPGYTTLSGARSAVAEAATVGFHATPIAYAG